MMKFFRKHQKTIMWLMVLLMVVFGVQFYFGSKYGGGGGRSAATGYVGQYTLGGKTVQVDRNDVASAYADLELLSSLGENAAADVGRYITDPRIGRPRVDRDYGGLVWYLWGKVIESCKVTATEDDRIEFFKARGITDEQVNKVRDDRKTTIAAINEAVDRLVAVNKLTRLVGTQASAVSTYDVQRAVRDISEKAVVNLAKADIDEFVKITPEPAEDTLAKLFDKHRNVLPSRGTPGYLIPDRVSLELLTVDALSLVSDDQVKDYYTKHPDKFTESVPASQPATRPAGATQPSSSQPEMVRKIKPLTADLMKDIRAELVSQPGEEGEVAPQQRVATALESLARKISISRTPTSYPDAAKELKSKSNLDAKVIETGDFSQEDLDKKADDETLRLISRSQPLQRGYSIADMAFNCAALPVRKQVSPDFVRLKADEQRADVYRQDTKYFIWRLKNAFPAHSPTSQEDVRAEVRKDATRQAAREIAREQLDKLAEQIKAGRPLKESLAAANAELAKKRKPTTQPAMATQPDFIAGTWQVAVYRKSLEANYERFQQLLEYYRQRDMLTRDTFAQIQQESMQLTRKPPEAAPSPEVIDSTFKLAEKFMPSAETT
ncbi:MAG: hypothetical protein PHU85_16305, partial [Phycisphaerae bacterium]|nr:hypothetical protein [Phycisphaerae bacterium]